MTNLILYIFILSVILSGCSNNIIYFQPNIPNGGRATAVTAKPFNEDKIVIASETGGLFYTTNKGEKWWHAFTGTFIFTDVDYIPVTNIVIATAKADTRVKNMGGIWRSTNNGENWKRIELNTQCAERLSAYCVTPESSNKVWVGTNCGAYYSADDGLTWQKQNTPYTDGIVVAIQAFGSKIYLLIRDIGLIKSDDGGVTWVNISDNIMQPITKGGVHNSIFTSRVSSNQVYYTTYARENGEYVATLFYTPDGGISWQNLKAEGGINRPLFVRVFTISEFSQTHFVYFGNGKKLFRKLVRQEADGNFTFNEPWEQLELDHADPSDICFEKLERKPLFLVGDGGIHKTSDYGKSWHLTGSNLMGYNALQITEVAGQVYSPQKFDLLFATQDNSIWGSKDNGNTWPEVRGGEGYWLSALNPFVENSKTSGVSCVPCGNFQAGPALTADHAFPNAPNQIGTPALIKPDYYLQNTRLDGATGNTFMLTKNNGDTWSNICTFSDEIRTAPTTVVNGPDDPVFYIPVFNGYLANGDRRFTIKKILKIMGEPEDVRIEDIENFGGLGIFRTQFSFYKVFGANPANPDHIIIGDIEAEVMKVSHDGGQTWTVDNELTNLVTDNGKLLFRNAGSTTQCQVIAFDPIKPWHILIGTTQAGIIRSTDYGNSWKYVENSKQIHNISSFFFHQNGVVFSSYGRGLYKLNQTASSTPPVWNPPVVVKKSIPTIWDIRSKSIFSFKDYFDKYDCKNCELHLVKNGNLKSFAIVNERDLEIGIDGEYLIKIDQNGEVSKSLLVVKKDTTQANDLSSQFGISKNKLKDVKGLIIQDNKPKGILFYEKTLAESTIDQLNIKINHTPTISVVHQKKLVYTYGFAPGEPMVVTGKYFSKEAFSKFQLYVNNISYDEIAQKILISDDGSFKLTFSLPLLPGSYEIKIVQLTETKKVEASSDFIIINNDEEK